MATVVFGVGYVGSRLVQELLYQGGEVVALDNLFASDERAIDGFRQAPGFQFVEGNIADREAVDRALEAAEVVDAVYLLAAQASAHSDAATPEYSEESNLRGPRIILEALIRHDVDAPVVYASSTRVYGSPLPSVVDESSPYGAFGDLAHLSKCYAEKLAEMYAAQYRLRCRVVRLGLVYGVAPVMKVDPRFMTAPNLFCFRAARGEAIEIRNNDPLAVIHVDDAMRALIWSADRPAERGYAVFNAASAVTTIPDIASRVRGIGETRELTVVVRDVVRSSRSATPLPRITSRLDRLGFVSRRQLDEGLAETLDHFLVHEQ